VGLCPFFLPCVVRHAIEGGTVGGGERGESKRRDVSEVYERARKREKRERKEREKRAKRERKEREKREKRERKGLGKRMAVTYLGVSLGC
jgi:hypothetical protein